MDKNNLIISRSAMEESAVADILSCNALTVRYGIKLTEEDAKSLVQTRTQALKNSGRIEFTGGALSAIITAFADSPYLADDTYLDTLHLLVETFYEYKTETLDTIDDDDLIALMRRHFDRFCHGSAELLREDVLSAISKRIRFGEDIDQEDDEFDE
jgi:hypothetical protein